VAWQFKEPEPGDVIAGRYRVDEELGRGGFGIVLRAQHLDTQRPVAVKVLHSTFARSEPTAVERFRREAVMSASLNYPNTVSMYDYGETEEGVFFIVMEYLIGLPLHNVVRKAGRLSAARALHIARQMLCSLWEAHEKGIVHRDIKPENIMITPLLHDQDFVKVMDFGIAKMAHGSGPQITKAGQTYGTPQYMAPEQLQGHQLEPSTDLYAVGLILYEMLVGRPAVETNNLAAAISEVIFGAPVEVPDDLDVPEGVRALVKKACAKEPHLRYTSAKDFLEDLDAVTRDTGGLDTAPAPLRGPPVEIAVDAPTMMLDASPVLLPAAETVSAPIVELELPDPAPQHTAMVDSAAPAPAAEGHQDLMRYGCLAAGVAALFGWVSVIVLLAMLMVR
jgi:eukaryotic-like serine/threonine-protein kinase